MAKLVIFGTGDIARLAKYYFTRDSIHDPVGFTVDSAFREDDRFEGMPCVDFESVTRHFPPEEHMMFIAVSYARLNRVRAEKYTKAKEMGYTLASYVSSKCTCLTDEPIGDNCFILEDNTIQPFVKIGNNVTLWSGNHIGHDAVIEDHNFLASQIVVSGRVHIKPYCFVGVNVTFANNITIEEQNIIGAGAVVTKSTNPEEVHVPAKSQVIARKSSEIKL